MHANANRLRAALERLNTSCDEACVETILVRYCSSKQGLARRLNVRKIVERRGLAEAARLARYVHDLDARREHLSLDQFLTLPDVVAVYLDLVRKGWLNVR